MITYLIDAEGRIARRFAGLEHRAKTLVAAIVAAADEPPPRAPAVSEPMSARRVDGIAMSSVPSIKGSVFSGVVEDVNKLLQSGLASRREAKRWLQPQDFALLEEPVVITRWYDIEDYTAHERAAARRRRRRLEQVSAHRSGARRRIACSRPASTRSSST